MAAFIKHIGKHADRKVAIIYRTVPGEEHMALVVYPDTLQTTFHDAIMRVIESDVGQSATELADALHKELLPDGRQILQTLHKEGMIKKVQTNQIVVTPNATSHVRLDELNNIFDGLEQGEEATKKMSDLDNNAGLVDPAANRMNANDDAQTGDMLSDAAMAANLINQGEGMEADAKGLLTESKRLKAEAKAKTLAKPKRASKKRASKKKAVKKSK